ncbi:MAG: DegV family protein [Anaerolineales bacterium]|nr:DegV family protein [Anaerolineales bacterium]
MNAHANRIAVVTDSTADIPENLAADANIAVVPAILIVNGRSYTDGRDINRGELYAGMDLLDQLPSTAIPSPRAFSHVYQNLLDRGAEHIISIHVSRKLSGMLNAVHQGAQSFGDHVHPIDSGQVSLGLGFQALEIARMAGEGIAIETILEQIGQLKIKARTIAGIESLEYLKRSGRVSWLRAEIGLRLRLRLILEVVDGDVLRHSIVRTRRQVLAKLSSIAQSWQPLQRLAVLHSGIPSLAEELAASLGNLAHHPPFAVDVTTVIGAHVGPRSIGLAGLIE